jgi:adenylosuccinate lyase
MTHPFTAVCPIDSGRYGSDEMRAIFADEGRYRFFILVEGAVAKVQSRLALIPEDAGPAIWSRAQDGKINLERARAIEAGSRHELMAVVQAFAETCGQHGRYVHCGPTSSDVIDTAIALQLKATVRVLDRKLRSVVGAFCDLASQHRTTPMVGRTHGQHALPITFGFKVAGWADEALRHLERLEQLAPRILVGKMAGAVGSMAGFGGQGQRLQAEVMAELGLFAPAITTQIVSRDRIAELISWAALVASSLDTVATEVRNLQRPELGEVSEFFDEVSQVGSSTMPQKRNPKFAQDIVFYAAEIRTQVPLALEAVQTEHEADRATHLMLTEAESRASIAAGDMLARMTELFAGLELHPERMRRNLDLSGGLIMAEAVMLDLGRQIGRQHAHDVVYDAAQATVVEGRPFSELLRADPRVAEHLAPDAIEALLDPTAYTGLCAEMARAAAGEVRRYRDGRAAAAPVAAAAAA